MVIGHIKRSGQSMQPHADFCLGIRKAEKEFLREKRISEYKFPEYFPTPLND
jgi:hypothetical protein